MASRTLSAFALLIAVLQSSCGASTAAAPESAAADCDKATAGAVTYFVVDTSEGIDLGARERITAEVQEKVFPRTEQATRFVLLSPNAAEPYEPVELVATCLPGAPSERSSVLTQSRGDLKRADLQTKATRAAILQASKAAIADAMKQTDVTVGRSPLIETIIYISKRPDFLGAKHREIYLYSDMRQHSLDSTVYSKPTAPEYLRVSEFRTADLQGSSLHVLRFFRKKKINGDKDLQDFWGKWVGSAKGEMDWRE